MAQAWVRPQFLLLSQIEGHGFLGYDGFDPVFVSPYFDVLKDRANRKRLQAEAEARWELEAALARRLAVLKFKKERGWGLTRAEFQELEGLI